MKKIYLSLFLSLLIFCAKATSYTISIVGGPAYSPSTLTATVGDVITIEASGTHPLVEVDQTTWNANGNTAKAGGWGTKTSNYTFTLTTAGSIYYVCQNHVSMGMKGQITVNVATNVKDQSNEITRLNIFPNPAKEKFFIKFTAPDNGSIKGKLFNVTGAEVPFTAIDENYEAGEVSITYMLPARLPEGIYLLELIYGNKKSIHKVIVE